MTTGYDAQRGEMYIAWTMYHGGTAITEYNLSYLAPDGSGNIIDYPGNNKYYCEIITNVVEDAMYQVRVFLYSPWGDNEASATVFTSI